MPKKIISDITIPSRSIRQIPLSTEKKLLPKKEKISPGNRKPLNPKFVIWLIAIIALLVLFFGVSLIFSSAKLVIVPRIEKLNFNNETFVAKLDTPSTTNLSFEILKIEKSDGLVVEATEEKVANQKASGRIVIYNNYSAASQRLINNTRFEATNGKVYRISSSVIVPGYTKVAGKIVPGSIEAVVYADQAGENYNLKVADLTGDFKIPGFKGDPRYNSFYARIKTDIIGGFIGKQRIIADKIRADAEENIKLKLKEQLIKELYALKPESFIVLNDGYFIDYVKLPDTAVGNDKAEINIEGNLNGIIFNNSKLAKYIATKKIASFDSLPVELVLNDNLVTSFSAKENASIWKNKNIDIKFSGEAMIKWQYDTEAIKQDFAGKKESDLNSLIAKYKNTVLNIRVIFKPVWTRYVPDDLDKIKVIEEI